MLTVDCSDQKKGPLPDLPARRKVETCCRRGMSACSLNTSAGNSTAVSRPPDYANDLTLWGTAALRSPSGQAFKSALLRFGQHVRAENLSRGIGGKSAPKSGRPSCPQNCRFFRPIFLALFPRERAKKGWGESASFDVLFFRLNSSVYCAVAVRFATSLH